MRPIKVDEYMTTMPYQVDQDTSLLEVKELMHVHKLRHLPVVLNNKVVGVVTESQVREADATSAKGSVLVKEIMVTDPYVVKTGTPLAEVIKFMGKLKYGCTMIHNGQSEIVGIFTTTDAMYVLAMILKNPSFVHRVSRVEDVIDYDQIAALSG